VKSPHSWVIRNKADKHPAVCLYADCIAAEGIGSAYISVGSHIKIATTLAEHPEFVAVEMERMIPGSHW
jgi:hypothetical protein